MKKEIRVDGPYFEAYLDGDLIDRYENLLEAQDELEDEYNKQMNLKYDLYCEFCQAWFNKEDVQYRLDAAARVPFGGTFIGMGSDTLIPVCPVCHDDLEESR